jgi:acyl-[acyl-carrier-protein]-phospholipid O-acyltransferase/long-chain-fatty-acid--[acyl-carrier-protein] ligase
VAIGHPAYESSLRRAGELGFLTWAASLGLGADLSVWPWLVLPLIGLALFVLLTVWPHRALRLFLWLRTHSLYRLRVHGRLHVPAQGGVLLVCNGVTCLDFLFLVAAHRRPIRCVVFGPWTQRGLIRRLLRWTGAIASDGSSPDAITQALQQAADALARGEVVCLFAEGRRTPGGFVLPFHRSFEEVAKQSSAPIVPVWIDQAWGSQYHLRDGRFRWKWPQEVPYGVDVTFGAPLPASTSGGDVRQAIQKLSADRAIARTPTRRPVHRQFVRMAAHHPFRICFIDSSNPGRDRTYGGAYVAAVCLRRLLRPMLGDEPMVGVWLPPSTGGALANIAVAMLGKTSVNLNYSSSAEVVASAIRQSGVRHVLTSRRFTARLPLNPGPGVELIYLEDLIPRIGTLAKLRALLSVILLPGWLLERLLGLGGQRMDDLATIIFSSGSTGEPKGVMLTHGNVAANVESMVQATTLSSLDRALGVLPFFHSFGYTVTLWAPLQVGASAVYHPDPRQAKEIGELCQKYRCTIYLSTATFLRFCLKKCAADDFRSVRILMCGAEKLPQSLAQAFQEKFGVLPLEGYGCTELAPAVAANMPDQEIDGFQHLGNRPGSIGPPLPGIACRIVHPDTGEDLPVGAEGLLLSCGANVMRGYLNRPDLTQKVMRDGWYVTGDMGRIDADGFVTLTGRLARFAKVGGEMVPLERIEEELHELLGTSERVCAVTCVPDLARGERLVVLYMTQEELDVRSWCRGLTDRGLPNLWLPTERDFYPVPEIPILPSGKIDLKRVKETALKLTG